MGVMAFSCDLSDRLGPFVGSAFISYALLRVYQVQLTLKSALYLKVEHDLPIQERCATIVHVPRAALTFPPHRRSRRGRRRFARTVEASGKVKPGDLK